MDDGKKDIHALLLKRIPFVSEIDEKMACIVTNFGAILFFIAHTNFICLFPCSTIVCVDFLAEPICGSNM